MIANSHKALQIRALHLYNCKCDRSACNRTSHWPEAYRNDGKQCLSVLGRLHVWFNHLVGQLLMNECHIWNVCCDCALRSALLCMEGYTAAFHLHSTTHAACSMHADIVWCALSQYQISPNADGPIVSCLNMVPSCCLQCKLHCDASSSMLRLFLCN